MARVYFVTGKGGTGKSSLCRVLAKKLSTEKKKVLLLKIDSFSATASETGEAAARQISKNYWEQKLQLNQAVEEYFTTTVARLPIPGVFQKFASRLQEGITTRVLGNKYVMRFIEACPGLTPTIYLGKVCYEGKEGGPPQSDGRWDAVIVDAPSTGQALQIFESAKTLGRVITTGPIAKHIVTTLGYTYSANFEIHLVTLPEEGPLQECRETIEKIEKLDLKVRRIWINKVVPASEIDRLQSLASEDVAIQEVVATELERLLDQDAYMQEFEKSVGKIPITEIPEHLQGESIRADEVIV